MLHREILKLVNALLRGFPSLETNNEEKRNEQLFARSCVMRAQILALLFENFEKVRAEACHIKQIQERGE